MLHLIWALSYYLFLELALWLVLTGLNLIIYFEGAARLKYLGLGLG